MAKAYGISSQILKSRLKYGYSLEEALTMPVDIIYHILLCYGYWEIIEN